MKSTILATALVALTASAAFAESHSVVRMGTEGAYPPYNFINDDGEVDGFEREVGDELCARAELTCEWVTNDWDSIIPNLTSGNYDTIIAGMSITAERDEVIRRVGALGSDADGAVTVCQCHSGGHGQGGRAK